MKNEVTVTLYATKYGENMIVQAIKDKKFGFELTIENETEKIRKIISYEEILKLQKSIQNNLDAYQTAMDFDFKFNNLVGKEE